MPIVQYEIHHGLDFCFLCLVGCGKPTPPIPKINDQSGVDPLVQETINKQIARIEEKPRESNSWLVLGHLFFAHGYESEALEAYQAASELNPKIALSYVLQGVALQRQGELEAAMKAASRCTECRTAGCPSLLAPRIVGPASRRVGTGKSAR